MRDRGAPRPSTYHHSVVPRASSSHTPGGVRQAAAAAGRLDSGIYTVNQKPVDGTGRDSSGNVLDHYSVDVAGNTYAAQIVITTDTSTIIHTTAK